MLIIHVAQIPEWTDANDNDDLGKSFYSLPQSLKYSHNSLSLSLSLSDKIC